MKPGITSNIFIKKRRMSIRSRFEYQTYTNEKLSRETAPNNLRFSRLRVGSSRYTKKSILAAAHDGDATGGKTQNNRSQHITI